MTILYSAIAKEVQVLAQSASCTGNFTEVTSQILAKIPPHDEKLTYSSGNYLFHYISENKMVFFCITTDKFTQVKAFSFLNDIKKKFHATFADTPPVAIPYAMVRQPSDGGFARILEREMTLHNENKAVLPKVKAELDELKSIMVKNVDKMALRGERLETLMSRTDGLTDNTVTYRRQAVRVQRKYWWQNIRMYLIMALVAAILVYFIGASACGGLAWKSCVG